VTHIIGITLTEDAECPCCKGKGYLVQYDVGDLLADDERKFGIAYSCTHCQGDGTIKIERSIRYEPK
jgi:RecJ-like exonuclease